MGRFLLLGACGRRDPCGMRHGDSRAAQAGTQGCCWWEQPGAPRCHGRVSEHSVPCSTAPVFCGGDTRLCLAGVCLCEVLCLTEIQQLLSIFILFNQLLIMFSAASPLQAGTLPRCRCCWFLHGCTSSAPCLGWAAIGPGHSLAAGGIYLDHCCPALMGFYLSHEFL